MLLTAFIIIAVPIAIKITMASTIQPQTAELGACTR